MPERTPAQTGPFVNLEHCWSVLFGYSEHHTLRVLERTRSLIQVLFLEQHSSHFSVEHLIGFTNTPLDTKHARIGSRLKKNKVIISENPPHFYKDLRVKVNYNKDIIYGTIIICLALSRLITVFLLLDYSPN